MLCPFLCLYFSSCSVLPKSWHLRFFCLSLRGALERGRKGLCEGEVEEGSARVRANRAVLGRGRKGKREGEEGIARGSARARAKRECEGWRR